MQLDHTLMVFPFSELLKFGPTVRFCLWIYLTAYPDYYLAMVVNDDGMKWALVNLKEVVVDNFRERRIADFGWLDSEHIGGAKERQSRWDVLAADPSFEDAEMVQYNGLQSHPSTRRPTATG